MTLCYIQARAGSKRFPGKNKALWNGIPMVEDAIRKAQECHIFDTIIVTSDDREIRQIAIRCGVFPMCRSEETASDTATDDDVAREVLADFPDADIVCKLYPCVPLLKTSDMINAYQFMLSPGKEDWWDGVHSALLGEKGYYWKDAGAFYFFRAKAFREKKSMAFGSSFIWTREYVDGVDINTPEDLEAAKQKAGA